MKKLGEEIFLIIGLLFTNLIHCSWIFGNTSESMLVLANNVGRGGLFLFILFLGSYIWKHKDNLNSLILQLLGIYVISFLFHIVTDCCVGSFSGIKGTFYQFIRGTPGNLWIVYGALVFSILVMVYERFNLNKHNKALILFGGGYCIVALTLFCYANVYSGFLSFDNGFIMKAFNKILGSDRSPYVLAIPFMLIGAYMEEKKSKKWKVKLLCPVLFFVLWCVEVLLIKRITANYNIYMTMIGAISVISLYMVLKNVFAEEKSVSKKILTFYVALFGIQYSCNRFIVYYFDLAFVWQYLVWFFCYCVLMIVIITLLHKAGENVDKENKEKNIQ